MTRMSRVGGGGGGEGALAVVLAQAATMTPAPKTEPPQADLDAVFYHKTKVFELLHCHACRNPLKPPIFKCESGGHFMCAPCRVAHRGACAGAVDRCAVAEAFAGAARMRCGNERFGCDVADGVAYHDAEAHRRACIHAPCGCPESSCGFLGSRQMLLNHVSGPDHSRPVIVLRYGQPRVLTLPLSRHWHVLVGEEDRPAPADRDRNVFLVSVSARETGSAEVSLFCVRADGGGAATHFSSRISVEHSVDGSRLILESPKVSSSSLCSSGDGAPPVRTLMVPQDYLAGDSVPLGIHIDKLRPPPSPPALTPTTSISSITSIVTSTTPSPLAAAAATVNPSPFAAAAAVKFTAAESSKKRKNANPRKL